MLRDLVPADLVKLMGSSDWKKVITIAHAQDSGRRFAFKKWHLIVGVTVLTDDTGMVNPKQEWVPKMPRSTSWRSYIAGRRLARPSSRWNRRPNPTSPNNCWLPLTRAASVLSIPSPRWRPFTLSFSSLPSSDGGFFGRNCWWLIHSRGYRTGPREIPTSTWPSATWSAALNSCARRRWATRWMTCWLPTSR